MVQIIDYNLLLDNITNYLTVSNTTTAAYDLSTGLDTRVRNVIRGDLTIIPQFKPKYPLISLIMSGKGFESPAEVAGGRFNKIINLSIDITCVYDDYSEAEDSLWTMVRNVEANLRYNNNINDYQSSGFKIIYILPSTVAFSTGKDSAYNKSADISVDIKGHLKDI